MLMKSHIYPQAVISILRQFLSFRTSDSFCHFDIRRKEDGEILGLARKIFTCYLLLLTSYLFPWFLINQWFQPLNKP